MKKPLIWIVVAVTLLVLFPGLAGACAAVVAEAALWVSTQPMLVGTLLGLAAYPHLRKTKTKPKKKKHATA